MSISFDLVCDNCGSDEILFCERKTKLGNVVTWFQCWDCKESDYHQKNTSLRQSVQRWFNRG